MNRPTFVTMSTLVFTLIAYVTLAQTARAGDEAALMVHIAAALELAHGHGQ